MTKNWKIALTALGLTLIIGLVLVTQAEGLFLSKNYRAYNSSPHLKRLMSQDLKRCLSIDRTLSNNAPFSGGGRINFDQMDTINANHTGDVHVVNLRDDSGFYYKGQPISYYGIRTKGDGFRYHSGSNPIKQAKYKFRLWKAGLSLDDRDLSRELFQTEQQQLEAQGIHYINFDLERRNFASKWAFVDRAITFFESIPPGDWVHYHCASGRGRTSTLMLLHDIFIYGKKDTLEDILLHHYCLGGEDLQDTQVLPNGSWTKKNLEGRITLIRTFYDYMNAEDGYPNKKWTKWLDDNGIPVEFNLG